MFKEVLDIVLRSLAVYLFILVAMRLFGKKELTQLSVIDFVFILLISNSVQNAMVGSHTDLLGGIAAASSLFVVNYILKYIVFRSRSLKELLQGKPLLLIYHGRVLKEHLLQAKITHEELHAMIREHGVARFEEVDLAILETDGNISVLSNDFSKRSSGKRR